MIKFILFLVKISGSSVEREKRENPDFSEVFRSFAEFLDFFFQKKKCRVRSLEKFGKI